MQHIIIALLCTVCFCVDCCIYPMTGLRPFRHWLDFPIVCCCVYCCIYPMTGLCPYRHRLAYGISQYACSNILPWQLSLVAYVQHLRCPGTIIIILSTRVEHHRRVIGAMFELWIVQLSSFGTMFFFFFLLSTDLWSFVFVFCSCLLKLKHSLLSACAFVYKVHTLPYVS